MPNDSAQFSPLKTSLFPVVLSLVALQLVIADDFKTIDGKEYKNATVNRVEPDGLVITFSLAKILSSPKFLRNAKEGS
jgi:hypothetical protein